jgi:hypothetical protein
MGEVEKPRVGRWARVAGSPAGPSVLQRRVQRLLVLVYLALVAMGIWGPSQPRVFWTMLLPLLPITIVLIGFGNWRRICPLAFWGELGSRVERSEQRRLPKWMELHFFALTFGFLLVMLSIRLLAINGDGHWLSGSLVVLAVAAAGTNIAFTGKTWCNFICPEGAT